MCTTTYLSQHDLAVLTRLLRTRTADLRGAGSARAVDPAVLRLADLAGSSRLLGDSDDPRPRVSLGASVRYRVAGGDTDAVVIACPQDAHAMLPRVPVLTPLALGMLGHAEGCTVDIGLALGRTLRLDILEVQPPSGPSR
jgi:transcription elongation GreA/GreB family factor